MAGIQFDWIRRPRVNELLYLNPSPSSNRTYLPIQKPLEIFWALLCKHLPPSSNFCISFPRLLSIPQRNFLELLLFFFLPFSFSFRVPAILDSNPAATPPFNDLLPTHQWEIVSVIGFFPSRWVFPKISTNIPTPYLLQFTTFVLVQTSGGHPFHLPQEQ